MGISISSENENEPPNKIRRIDISSEDEEEFNDNMSTESDEGTNLPSLEMSGSENDEEHSMLIESEDENNNNTVTPHESSSSENEDESFSGDEVVVPVQSTADSIDYYVRQANEASLEISYEQSSQRLHGIIIICCKFSMHFLLFYNNCNGVIFLIPTYILKLIYQTLYHICTYFKIINFTVIIIFTFNVLKYHLHLNK
jgi:hypothetical protein